MNTILLLAAGAIIGGLVVYLWLQDTIDAYAQDCENHRQTAMTLSRKLAICRQEKELLAVQAGNLLDHAEYLPRDIQFPPSDLTKRR